MPTLTIVGLGPSDESQITLAALALLESADRVATCGVPRALVAALKTRGVRIVEGPESGAPPASLLHGEPAAVGAAVDFATSGDAALAVAGHPILDFPGLPNLLRALENARIQTRFVAGMPLVTLSAAAAAPLVELPPAVYSWEELVEIMGRLRISCPWDREQTHETILPYLIEEAHEVVEAVDERDDAKLRDELGDLLLHVLFHAQIASERGRFTIADVINALSEKMVRRHPHVFSDATISSTQEQIRSWELIKTQESSHQSRESLLDGVPKSLPALLGSQRIQEKAATVGFDWPQTDGVVEKVDEELAELKMAVGSGERDHIRDELGDTLFTLVNLARRLGIDAEAALRHANEKFRKRFAAMEKMAGGGASALAGASLDDLDVLWKRAKEHETRQVP